MALRNAAGEELKRTANDSSSTIISDPREVPSCLKRIVRTIVRSFYSRENSLIMDMLVRNTIMKEDDLCERLRFEKKQLRQYLHTLKSDQFIKSKLQLETDADGKTSKIIHYYIDYKLFVNIVKYRLDQMQRRLETEQRQTSSRALFKCIACNSAYTDLEVDRLFDPLVGGLVCVYCRAEVKEEEDNAQRSDARALVAKFHQKVRDPLDAMLKECDRVHLSSSILEPEIRALEPLPGQEPIIINPEDARHQAWLNDLKRSIPLTQMESTVTIVLSGSSNSSTNPVTKERPVWMSESTITDGEGLGELDRGVHGGGGAFSAMINGGEDSITQTLAPGRVPTAAHDTDISSSGAAGSGVGGGQSQLSSGNGDNIMQLLLVHERRGLGTHGPKSCLTKPIPTTSVKSSSSSSQSSSAFKNGLSDSKSKDTNGVSGIQHLSSKVPTSSSSSNSTPAQSSSSYTLNVGGRLISYVDVTSAMIKSLTPSEMDEYIRVGKRLYIETIVD